MKKGKFYVLLITLSVILIFISGFIYFFHEPYNRAENKVLSAKKEALAMNKIESFTEFTQYNSQDIYYIGQDEENIYVFNSDYLMVKKEPLETIQLDLVKERLAADYNVTDFSTLELGYENKMISYLCRQNLGNVTQYIYLNAQDGSEIKFYELGK